MGNESSRHHHKDSAHEQHSPSLTPTSPSGGSQPNSLSKATGAQFHPNAEMIGPYVVDHVLGKGSFAEVKLGRHVKTGEQVALKIISKSNLSKGKRRVHLQREIRFLKLLCHPNISMLYDVIEEDDHYVLIMEHAGGGELLQYIRNAEKHRLKEPEARKFFRSIVSAVNYCHQNFLIHRDIKPENVMLDDHGEIKIIDFGFSREFTPDVPLDSFIGSPHYAAPELLQGIKYSGPEVDLWSLGILLYVMICGRQPFKHPDMKVLYAKITKGEFEYPDHVSPGARDLINRLLRVNPRDRATMEEVMNHPWINEGYEGPPPSYLLERGQITEIDPVIFQQLLTYGFEAEEARTALLSNQKNMITTFYHLLVERRDRMAAHDQMMESSSPPTPSPLSQSLEGYSPSHNMMVRNLDTDEVVPLHTMEKQIRKKIIRHNSFLNEQKYFQTRFSSFVKTNDDSGQMVS